MQPTLVAAVLFGLPVAAAYAYVGRHLAKRRLSRDAHLAGLLFAGWWFGLSALTLLGAATSVLAALGVTDLALHVSLLHLALLLLCASLWALLYYLVYLFTGRRRFLLPLSIFYLAYYAVLVYYVEAGGPVAVEMGRWSAMVVYERTLAGPFIAVVLALLLVPQMLAAVAYFVASRRVHEPELRYRASVVTWAIFLWFGSALAASAAHVAASDAWQVGSRLIGLGAATSVLLAYRPPAWVRRRLGPPAPAAAPEATPWT